MEQLSLEKHSEQLFQRKNHAEYFLQIVTIVLFFGFVLYNFSETYLGVDDLQVCKIHFISSVEKFWLKHTRVVILLHHNEIRKGLGIEASLHIHC